MKSAQKYFWRWFFTPLVAVVAFGLLATAPAASAPAASPSPSSLRSLSSLRAQAVAVQAQMRALDNRLELQIERYDKARQQLDAVSGDLAGIRLQLTRARSDLQAEQRLLHDRLTEMYKMGDYTLLDVLVTAGDLTDAAARLRYFNRLGEQDLEMVQRQSALLSQLESLKDSAILTRDAARRLEQRVRNEEIEVKARLAERRALLAGLNRQIKKELARRDRLARQEAARLARESGVDLESIAVRPAQLAAVREAMHYLGLPYLYGGSLPSTGFDCSGFVMYVFAKFGVNIPHFAAWQEEKGTNLPLEIPLLQPADLVFFGSPIHHVGMYIGNGKFIHSPHTGDVIKISQLAGYGDWTAACRYPLRLPGASSEQP